MNIKTFQIHKRSSYIFKDIQDKYSINQLDNVYAVSDGATQGFMSQIWAEQLTNNFISNPTFDISSLIINFTNLAHHFNETEIKLDINPAIKALQLRKKQEGASATFIGVKIENKTLSYVSSGDVCGCILSKDKVIFFPHTSIEDLDKDKGFLNTKKLINNEISEQQFKTDKLSLLDGDYVILMTDAIARFILKNKHFLQDFTKINEFDSFKNIIIDLWETKVLEEDDITILCIESSHQVSIKEFLAEDLEFPKPSSYTAEEYSSISNEGDSFLKLTREVSLLKKDIYLLKQKIEKQDFLIEQQNKYIQKFKYLVIIIGVFIGLVFYMFYLNLSTRKEITNNKTNIVKKKNINNFSDSVDIKQDSIKGLGDTLQSIRKTNEAVKKQ